MTKYDHLTAMLILIVLGTAVTIKTTMSAAALHAATVRGRTVTIAAFSKSQVIIPAPVIDHDPRFFVGSGDASAGSWVKP
jgi:hypothetical protein